MFVMGSPLPLSLPPTRPSWQWLRAQSRQRPWMVLRLPVLPQAREPRLVDSRILRILTCSCSVTVYS